MNFIVKYLDKNNSVSQSSSINPKFLLVVLCAICLSSVSKLVHSITLGLLIYLISVRYENFMIEVVKCISSERYYDIVWKTLLSSPVVKCVNLVFPLLSFLNFMFPFAKLSFGLATIIAVRLRNFRTIFNYLNQKNLYDSKVTAKPDSLNNNQSLRTDMQKSQILRNPIDTMLSLNIKANDSKIDEADAKESSSDSKSSSIRNKNERSSSIEKHKKINQINSLNNDDLTVKKGISTYRSANNDIERTSKPKPKPKSSISENIAPKQSCKESKNMLMSAFIIIQLDILFFVFLTIPLSLSIMYFESSLNFIREAVYYILLIIMYSLSFAIKNLNLEIESSTKEDKNIPPILKKASFRGEVGLSADPKRNNALRKKNSIRSVQIDDEAIIYDRNNYFLRTLFTFVKCKFGLFLLIFILAHSTISVFASAVLEIIFNGNFEVPLSKLKPSRFILYAMNDAYLLGSFCISSLLMTLLNKFTKKTKSPFMSINIAASDSLYNKELLVFHFAIMKLTSWLSPLAYLN